MRIWEERQVSKYGKKETNRMFQYFQMYLQQTPPRSVKRLHDNLERSNEKSKEESKAKIPKFETLVNYCAVFNWVERANAYDQYQIELNRKNKELQLSKVYSDVADFNADELSISISLVDYPKKVIYDALKKYNNGEIVLDEFNKYVGDAIKNYRNAVELVQEYDPTPTGVVVNNNNVNQMGDDNQLTFHNLMREKGDVIDEYLRDEDQRKGEQDTR